MVAVRLDVKTILGMFNQSKMAAEESIDKDRLAEMNRVMEQKKIDSENDWNQKRFDIQKGEADANAVLRTQQMKELLRPHEIRGKAKELFTPDMFKYNNIHPDADVTNEQFDAAVAHTEKMTAYDTQRQVASMSSASSQMKAQNAWQLQMQKEKDEKEAAQISWASTLPTMDTTPVGYQSHWLYDTLDRQNAYNNTVLTRLNEGIKRQEAIQKAAKDTSVTGKGINPYAMTAAESLNEEAFLNSIYDVQGNPTPTFRTGSGLGDQFSNAAQSALITQIKQANSRLRGLISNNSVTQGLKLKLSK